MVITTINHSYYEQLSYRWGASPNVPSVIIRRGRLGWLGNPVLGGGLGLVRWENPLTARKTIGKP